MKFVLKNNILSIRTFAVSAAILGLGVASASAANFSFIQSGYPEGAAVTGSFAGEDINSDGWLTYFPLSFDTAELSTFSVSFSGNSMVDAFSFGLADLQEFSFFMMGDNSLGNDFSTDPFSGGTEGMSVFNINYGYFTGQASNLVDGGTVQNFNSGAMSDTSLVVTVEREDANTVGVPDSGGAASLLVAGLAGIALMRRKLRN